MRPISSSPTDMTARSSPGAISARLAGASGKDAAPFGAVDAHTRLIMRQILTNMWQRLKISVLFVKHDNDEAIFLSDRAYVMTARPGSIKAEIAVPLPRPWEPSLIMSSEFLALRLGLISPIREESLKAIAARSTPTLSRGLRRVSTDTIWRVRSDELKRPLSTAED
jgi:hypothetical protein